VIRTSESKDRLCRHGYTYTDLVVDRKEKEEEGRKRDVGNRNSRDVVVQQQHAAQGLLVLRHDQRRPGRVDDRLVVGVGQRARETRHARAEYVARRRQRDGHGRGALDYTSLPLSLYND